MASIARTLCLLAASGAPLAAASITVELPHAAPRASLEVALYGRGLCMRSVAIERSTAIDLDALAAACLGHDFRPIDEVRLALLAPGFEVATFIGGAAEAVWRPELTELPRWTLAGRLESPPGDALRLTLSSPVRAMMPFFEYFDGGLPELFVGETTVAADGSFELTIADLRHDPFLAASPHEVTATVSGAAGGGRREEERRYRFPLERLFEGGELVLGAELAWPPGSQRPD